MLSAVADLHRANGWRRESCVRMTPDVARFAVSQQSRANRAGYERQPGADSVVERPEEQLPSPPYGQMGSPSGECSDKMG